MIDKKTKRENPYIKETANLRIFFSKTAAKRTRTVKMINFVLLPSLGAPGRTRLVKSPRNRINVVRIRADQHMLSRTKQVYERCGSAI